MRHPAQPRHTNHWAPRTRKRHQQEHRPQRPTERSDPTQHAKGRMGDCPGPRKGTTTRQNVTPGGEGVGMPPWVFRSHLQPAAPIGRSLFAALPLDPLPPQAVVPSASHRPVSVLSLLGLSFHLYFPFLSLWSVLPTERDRMGLGGCWAIWKRPQTAVEMRPLRRSTDEGFRHKWVPPLPRCDGGVYLSAVREPTPPVPPLENNSS